MSKFIIILRLRRLISINYVCCWLHFQKPFQLDGCVLWFSIKMINTPMLNLSCPISFYIMISQYRCIPLVIFFLMKFWVYHQLYNFIISHCFLNQSSRWNGLYCKNKREKFHMQIYTNIHNFVKFLFKLLHPIFTYIIFRFFLGLCYFFNSSFLLLIFFK